jgi:hypothetical protein
MSSWSKRRKLIYSLVTLIVIAGAVGLPLFLLFYDRPTCSDGVMNGREQGVDCGGSCERLCQSSFLAPSLAWTRFEEIAPSLYNLAAYIVNPNTDAEALNVPYHIALYDNRGVIITDTNGVVTLPPHRNTIAFQSAINVGERIPAKALFEFTAPPNWNKKKDSLSAVSIGEKKYLEDNLGSSLTVSMRNTSVYPLYNVAVYAVLYDKDGNALGFSKTILDEIPPQQSVLAPFTWPINRQGKVISIEVLPVQE